MHANITVSICVLIYHNVLSSETDWHIKWRDSVQVCEPAATDLWEDESWGGTSHGALHTQEPWTHLCEYYLWALHTQEPWTHLCEYYLWALHTQEPWTHICEYCLWALHTQDPWTHICEYCLWALHTQEPWTDICEYCLWALHTQEPWTHLCEYCLWALHTQEPWTHLCEYYLLALHTQEPWTHICVLFVSSSHTRALTAHLWVLFVSIMCPKTWVFTVAQWDVVGNQRFHYFRLRSKFFSRQSVQDPVLCMPAITYMSVLRELGSNIFCQSSVVKCVPYVACKYWLVGTQWSWSYRYLLSL